MVQLLAALGIVGITGAILAIATIWRGYVLSVVWGWLVVPMFGFPPITLLGAIIISLVVGFLVYQHNNCKKADNNEFGTAIGIAFIWPLMVLGIAWVVKLFM